MNEPHDCEYSRGRNVHEQASQNYSAERTGLGQHRPGCCYCHPSGWRNEPIHSHPRNTVSNAPSSQYMGIDRTSFTSVEYLPTVSGPLLQSIHNLDGSTTNIIFDVHRYNDVDHSGTHVDCVTNSIDVLSVLATWLRNGNRHAFLSEMGGGNVTSCLTDVCQQLVYLKYVTTLASYLLVGLELTFCL